MSSHSPDLAARLTLVCLLIALCSSPAALVAADGSQGQGNQQKTTVSLNGQAVSPRMGPWPDCGLTPAPPTGRRCCSSDIRRPARAPDYRAVLDLNAGDRIQLALPAPSGPGKLEVRCHASGWLPPRCRQGSRSLQQIGLARRAFHQFEVASSARHRIESGGDRAGWAIDRGCRRRGPIALQLDRLVWKTGAAAIPLSRPIQSGGPGPWNRQSVPRTCGDPGRRDDPVGLENAGRDRIAKRAAPFAEAIHKRIPQIDQLVGDLRRKKVDLGAW